MNPLHDANLVAEVRAEMARQATTATRLSQASGIGQSSLSRKLSGASPFTLGEVLSVCDALGITLAELAARAVRSAA